MSGTNVPPALTVFSNGSGVLTDQEMNTFMQSGALLAQLRAFSGISSMTVFMLGAAYAGDGLQGIFYWNATAITADDGGVTSIQPNGVLYGRWLRLSSQSVLGAVGAVAAVTTIASLRLAMTATLPQTLAYVDGYYNGDDGGQGMFWYKANDTTSADNNGTIIVDASNRRWFRSVGSTALNVQWFGPGSDYSPALTYALAALNSPGGQIYFPPGVTYTFASNVAYTIPSGQFSVAFVGGGADTTVLYWPSANGITINASSALHSAHFRDLTFSTNSNGSYIAINLNNSVLEGNFAQSDVVRCTFRGSDGGQGTYYWSSGVFVAGMSNVNYEGCLFYGNGAGTGGIGLNVNGNSAVSPYFSIVHNVSQCGFFNLGIGFNYGNKVQGVTISQCNFTNGVTGIFLPSSSTNAAQLAVTASQFNTTANQINLNGALTQLLCQGNLFYVPYGNSGITFGASANGAYHTITGNMFNGPGLVSGAYGIYVGSVNNCTAVTGNSFYDFQYGVELSGTSGWTVGTNAYNTVTTPVHGAAVIGGNTVGVATP